MTHFSSPAVPAASCNSILLRAKCQGETQDNNSFVATQTVRQLMRRAVPVFLTTNLLKIRDVLGGVPRPRKSIWITLCCDCCCFCPPKAQYWALGGRSSVQWAFGFSSSFWSPKAMSCLILPRLLPHNIYSGWDGSGSTGFPRSGWDLVTC